MDIYFLDLGRRHSSLAYTLQEASSVHPIISPTRPAPDMTTTVQNNVSDTETIRLLPWTTDFVKVVNNSNFALVLTFVDEDRLVKRSKEQTTTVAARASAAAGPANPATGEAELSYENMEKVMFGARDCVVDKNRVLLQGAQCKVHFPRKCKELRVLGCYQQPSDKNKLVPWKNSLYSRSVRITAKVINLKFLVDEEEVGPRGALSLPSLQLAGIILVSLCLATTYAAKTWL